MKNVWHLRTVAGADGTENYFSCSVLCRCECNSTCNFVTLPTWRGTQILRARFIASVPRVGGGGGVCSTLCATHPTASASALKML